jgi:hypothetical protein
MRTAERVLDEIKKVDPETEVTLHYIRALIRAEAVPVVACGRKKLVNVDAVMELLASGYTLPTEPQPLGVIRKVI